MSLFCFHEDYALFCIKLQNRACYADREIDTNPCRARKTSYFRFPQKVMDRWSLTKGGRGKALLYFWGGDQCHLELISIFRRSVLCNSKYAQLLITIHKYTSNVEQMESNILYTCVIRYQSKLISRVNETKSKCLSLSAVLKLNM